ncbi:MAG: cytidine deaminase [Legionella longbeachae]|nr:cytidine deaminase [Legionella longbeachae]
MDPIIAKMITQALETLPHSYAPYYKFHVACCIRTDKDNLYTGVNVENSSYSLGVCAETSAISAMIAGGEQRIRSVVVLAKNNLLCAPCGACRQRFFEFSTPDTIIHLCNKDSLLRSLSMNELLPLAFDFKPK